MQSCGRLNSTSVHLFSGSECEAKADLTEPWISSKPRLSDCDSELLSGPLTLSEVLHAVDSLPASKTPAYDGVYLPNFIRDIVTCSHLSSCPFSLSLMGWVHFLRRSAPVTRYFFQGAQTLTISGISEVFGRLPYAMKIITYLLKYCQTVSNQ